MAIYVDNANGINGYLVAIESELARRGMNSSEQLS